ncbi:AIPR family protein [Melittangium boletus]|uniref:AIPR family protein n=1 Tax=Melittangium boletus TaxID=83453 RepID=UPI003DA280BD
MAGTTGKAFTFTVNEYRSLPLPLKNVPPGKKPRIGTFFAKILELSPELRNTMGVNPRTPVFDKFGKVKGPVARDMRETLKDDASLFALKNQGIWILCDKVKFEKKEGEDGVVRVTLTDLKAHGVVNGGHTLHVLLEAVESMDPEKLEDAYVRLHLLEDVDPELVTELAEGLNTSMQVDDRSLKNLAGAFDGIEKVMKGKSGANEIVYHQGDDGEINVLSVLSYMALFDIERYPGWKKHPNGVFGQSKHLLEEFAGEDADKNLQKSFKVILPKLPEILVLADRIQQLAWERCAQRLGRRKLSSSKTAQRAGAKKFKNTPAHFAGGSIGGDFAQGWLFPILAAFRANVSPEDWAKGKMTWLVPVEDLLNVLIEDLVNTALEENDKNNKKPAEVGRRDSAYKLCYTAVMMELLRRGKLKAA